MRFGTILCLLTVMPSAAVRANPARPPDLEALFRAEIELAAHKLRLDPGKLDPKLALALAVAGVTWSPASDGNLLIKQEGKNWTYSGWAGRWEGLLSASASADARTEFAFALSLILDPAPDAAKARHAFGIVSRYGDGLDLALMGIVGAPRNVPLIPSLQYAAADALVWRCDTRHTQFWLALADSGDSYLRSRAIVAIGLVAYSANPAASGAAGRTGHVPFEGLIVPVRESPISAAQRLMFKDVLIKAADHRSYRVRAAAALALGLMGGDEARDRLVRLAKDRTYIVTSARSGGMRTIVFPVRDVAAAALKRYGVIVRPSGGTFNDRDFRTATRGCRDVTRDTSGMVRGLRGGLRFYEGLW